MSGALRAPVAGAVALTLIVAACSGDNKSATPTTTAPTIAPASSTTAAPTAEPKFTFGFVAPSAPLLLDLAYAQENALSLAVADINDGGGVLGAPVKATTTDDQVAGSVADAVTDLVDGGANAVLGPVGSTDARAAIPAVAGAGSLACSASATVPDLNSNPPAAAFYRTALPDSETVEFVAAQLLAQRDAVAPGKPWKVVIVARGDDYGTSVSSGLSAILAAQGVTTDVVTYLPEQTSLSQPAAEVVAQAPNAVVAVTYEEAPRLLDQLVNQGIPAASITGLDAMFVPRLAEMTFPSDPSKLDGMTVIGVTGDRAFLRRLGALPSGQVLYGAQLYDCAIVIALAAEAARSTDPAVYGPELNTVLSGDRPCSTYADCHAKLAAGESIAYQGQIGSFTFSPTNSPTASRFTVANLANGNFVVAKTVNLDLTALQAAHAAELAMAAAVQTTRIQQALTALGLYSGPIDGHPSDALTASIAALQQQLGLPATGVYDAETDAALRQRVGAAGTAVSEATSSLQRALRDLGHYDGPIDGVYSNATVAGVRAFQASIGVPQTGIVDADTVRAVYALGAASVPPAPEPTTAPPTTPAPAPPTEPPTAPATPPATEPPTPPPATPAPTTPPTPAPTEPPTTKPTTTKPTTTVPTSVAPPATGDIVRTLRADPRFTTYVELLVEAGLADSLALLGPVTVFAPTNDAFATLPAGALDEARADPTKLHDLLLAGMAEGRLTTAELTSGTTITSLSGTSLTVGGAGDVVTVNGVTLTPPELDASNGIIQPTSGVLRPGA
jgi:branched-chain amino acid transport system substrate-binding protein